MKYLLLLALMATSLGAIEPVKTHPRLLFRAADLPELRSRMVPSNDAWTHFKNHIADTCLREWKCTATHHQSGPPNYTWVRDSFTDENGVTHLPADPDWSTYARSSTPVAASSGSSRTTSSSMTAHGRRAPVTSSASTSISPKSRAAWT